MANAEKKESVAAAKALVRGAGKAALGTLMPDGSPLTTLVAIANEAGGAPLLLLSQIAAHTQNIARDPRVSLLIEGTAADDDPMTTPRLTINGELVRLEGEDAQAAKSRFLSKHRHAEPYDRELDFHYYRLQIENGRFNQGFGRFRKLTAKDLLDAAPDADGQSR